MPNMVDVGRPGNKRTVAAKQAAAEEDEGGWGDTAALLDWEAERFPYNPCVEWYWYLLFLEEI